MRRKEAVVLTAKLTAILSDIGNRQRTSAESGRSISIWGGRRRTAADVRNAVFKTVCGALLRRPGWVRFPSIPAMSCLRSSRPLSQLIRDQSRWGHPLVDPVGVHDQVAMGRPSSVQMRMCVGDASCDAFRLRAVARRVAESTKHKSLDTA